MLQLEDRVADCNGAHIDEAYTDELVRRCQKGDRKAFNELVLQQEQRIYQLAYRVTRSTDGLDDLVQDIFLRVHG